MARSTTGKHSSQLDGAPTLDRTSTEQVLAQAERQASKTEAHGAVEDESHDRILGSIRSASADRGGDRGTTLPVVEEVGEGGSTGGRSGHSHRSREVEQRDKGIRLVPFDDDGLEQRNTLSPPLGGRPPPTPPKDFVAREKMLPLIPQDEPTVAEC